MTAIVSSRLIQLIHWRPSPRAPPRPSRNGNSIFARAPPAGLRTIPIRSVTTRTPRAIAPAVAASHSRETSAREPGPDPLVHAADAGGDCPGGGPLPFARDLGEVAGPRPALFREDLVAAVAVVAGRRGADEHGRRWGHPGARLDQAARGSHAAVADPLLVGGRPPAVRDALARQMHDGVGERGPARRDGAGERIPPERALPRPRIAPDEPDHAVAVSDEGSDERRAEQAARPGDGDDHAIAPPSMVEMAAGTYDAS